VKFSIVTPSFRNSCWLKLCIASVADQQGVAVEHLVQDSCSDDGTQDWLPNDPRVQSFIEKDTGMYDAVNRGYRRATGDILAYLNCDEQYLPGALARVEKFFAENPKIEAVFAGAIVTDGEGKYLCHRHALLPDPRYAIYKFSVLTAATFIRRKIVHQRGIFFDPRWRDLGDYHWVMELQRRGVPLAVLDYFTSSFTDTGENMNLKPNARRELAETIAVTPRWVRLLKPAWTIHHRLRRIAGGHFSLKPTSYEIYTPASPERRVHFAVPKPTGIWRTRL
jgi:glycosyltransferase involved in cell wall biosynthesis